MPTIKYENFSSLRIHTINSMQEDAHLFDDYTMEKSRMLLDLEKDAEEKSKIFRTVNAHNEATEDADNELLKDSYKFFSVTYGIVQKTDSSLTKIYFKDNKPQKAKGNSIILLKAFKNGLVIINNDEYDELDLYKDKYLEYIQKLEEFIPIQTEKNNNFVTAKKNLDDASLNFTNHYGMLKYLVRAQLYGKGLDYKKYFLDLLKRKSTTSSAEKPQENVENIENVKNPEDNSPS